MWGRSCQLARSAVETSARPRDDPRAYSAAMAKAARLNSKLPTTAATPMASCATPIRQEGAQRLIFDQPLRFAPRTPCDQIRASSGLSESCQKTQTYRTLRFLAVAALVPSAGT